MRASVVFHNREGAITLFDRLVLLLTGLVAIYLLWRFWNRYSAKKALPDLYYMLGFAVLLVSGLLLITLGYDILASPYVLTVASLIPLGISLGVANQSFVLTILTPLLLLMSLALAWGFTKDTLRSA